MRAHLHAGAAGVAGAEILLMSVAGCAGGQAGADSAGTSQAEIDPTADVAVIRRGSLRQVLLLSGELRSVGAADIVVPDSPQRDPVIRWMIEEGASVEVGDRMVELDTSQIASQLDARQIDLEETINELNERAAEIAGEFQDLIIVKAFDAFLVVPRPVNILLLGPKFFGIAPGFGVIK